MVAAAVASVIALAYFVWTTTPFYAFQEAVSAAQYHDLAKFRQRVDVERFVDSLIDELLVRPADSTPGLSPLQREVCRGAVTLAATAMQNQMVRGIEKAIIGSADTTPQALNVTESFGLQPAYAAEKVGTKDIYNLLKVTASEVGGSVGKMSREAYDRMRFYAFSHRNTTPGRLLACPPDQRGAELQSMLREFGLSPNNFKGVSSYSTIGDAFSSETCQITFSFFSPKVAHPVNLKVELTKESTFAPWQITKLVALDDFFREQGEDYYAEMHALMQYSLAGMSERSVNSQMRSITDRIKQNPSTRDILEKLNIR